MEDLRPKQATFQTSVAINPLVREGVVDACHLPMEISMMMKSTTVSTEHSDDAMAAADRLVQFATEVLELATEIHHELELAGEIPEAFVKSLRRAIIDERKALQALIGSYESKA